MRYFLMLLVLLMVGCGPPYGAPIQQQQSGLYAQPATRAPATRAPAPRVRRPHVFAPPARTIPITARNRPAQPVARTSTPGTTTSVEGSWYGERHHGNTTASGEPFDMYALTAAHKTLRFGTRVRVTYPRTGKSVEVRINDRCGHHGKIDLSKAAAEVIGLVRAGRAQVNMTILR